ncbi:MAG: chlorophyll synthesis pathway protein BchC [Pseudomonadota bacterium]
MFSPSQKPVEADRRPSWNATAVVLQQPGAVDLRELELSRPGPADLVVDIEWSGISSGTERLLWKGTMPRFPGMGYPLVPGYESVGRVREVGQHCTTPVGSRVFVAGASCFGDIRGLFGGAASRVVVAESKTLLIGDALAERGILLALAATAVHALHDRDQFKPPELIVGHGVLGRLLARATLALGGEPPVVWETNAARRSGGQGYPIIDPATDDHSDYRRACDVSGAERIIDAIAPRLGRGGELVLAGFYSGDVSFAFAAAFMRELKLRISAEWQPRDLAKAHRLVDRGALSLDDLITHRLPAAAAADAYATAFDEPECLKMVLDWRAST